MANETQSRPVPVPPVSHSAGDAELTGIHYRTGEPVVVTAGGTIRDVRPAPERIRERGGDLPLVAPGLVDLQINGFRGIDFNTPPLDPGRVAEAARAIAAQGVTTCFPTVITNDDGAIGQAVRAIAEACERDARTEAAVGGIHLEGPFISPEDGPRGAHDRRYVKPPDWELFQRWQEAAWGRIRIVTLSPEWPGACRFIERCVRHRVRVAIGHTAASPDQIRDAVAAGATLSTHLGNGAHPVLPRHPNYIWEQLAKDSLWAYMIADGFHLPDAVLKVFMRVKGRRAILVSDAVSLGGMPPGTYRTPIGGEVVLHPSGRLSLAADPNLLAGSAQMLLRGVEHVARRGLAPLADAWDMASVRPAEALELSVAAGLAPGAPADLALFRKSGDGIGLLQTFKRGVPVS